MPFHCLKCEKEITDDEYHFSNRNFGKALCRIHQPTPEAWKLGKKLKEIGKWKVVYEGLDGYKSADLSIPRAKVDIEVDIFKPEMTKEQALIDLKQVYHSNKKDSFLTLHVPNILVQDDESIGETAKWINDFLAENYKIIKDNFIVRLLKKLFI